MKGSTTDVIHAGRVRTQWRSPVTSGKRDICKLQPGHDDEGCLKSTSSEKILKAGVEVSTEGGI